MTYLLALGIFAGASMLAALAVATFVGPRAYRNGYVAGCADGERAAHATRPHLRVLHTTPGGRS